MPRRTNAFQHLIARIEGALNAGEGRIAESHELRDKITGQLREVDVVVTLAKTAHPILISVECRGGSGRARPVSVEWVEQMWGKHTSLPTNKLILVARGGFTKAARQKAACLGVECYSLGKAESLDWKPKLRQLQKIDVTHFLLPRVTRAVLVFPPDVSPPIDITDVGLLHPILHSPDGTSISASDLVQKWVMDPAVVSGLQQAAFDDAGTTFQFQRKLRPGTVVVGKSGRRYPVVAIDVEGQCRKRMERLEVTKSSYANTAIAHGNAQFLGNKLMILIAEKEDGRTTVGVSVEPRTGSNSALQPTPNCGAAERNRFRR